MAERYEEILVQNPQVQEHPRMETTITPRIVIDNYTGEVTFQVLKSNCGVQPGDYKVDTEVPQRHEVDRIAARLAESDGVNSFLRAREILIVAAVKARVVQMMRMQHVRGGI